jgi:hypothetical protein
MTSTERISGRRGDGYFLQLAKKTSRQECLTNATNSENEQKLQKDPQQMLQKKPKSNFKCPKYIHKRMLNICGVRHC